MNRLRNFIYLAIEPYYMFAICIGKIYILEQLKKNPDYLGTIPSIFRNKSLCQFMLKYRKKSIKYIPDKYK